MRALLVTALSVVAMPSLADPPTERPFEVTFDDLNPCTDEIHTVFISGTSFVHDHDGQTVVRSQRTIETSTGFVGHGTDTAVANGNISLFRLSDILTNEAGDKIHAKFVLVIDDAGNALVMTGEVSCLV